MESVSGKVIMITGGSGGIGSAMVKELLQNGAKGVAIVDFSPTNEDLACLGPDRTIFIKTDVTKKEELENAFDTTVQTFNQLDIVINNAGIIDEFQWKKTVAVNFVAVVEGTYLAMQKYLPKYRSGPEGVIVNTASIAGIQALQDTPMYCATKHAVVGLGRSLGGEEFYKKYQVRVLTLLPHFVRTPMTGKELKVFFPHMVEQALKKISTRMEPERVGKALVEVIEKGKTGSLWVIDDDESLYEIGVPNYKTMKVVD